ncbi:MAG: protein tyrosine phosphatase [Roseivirga sp.]|nr:protein tyrosine phosphatase [Roseivirga sp.]
MNLLFICSRNKWRSRTAEIIFKNRHGFQVRSAGTAASARIKVTEKMLNWAEIIFVMEKNHKQRLLERYPQQSAEADIIVLEIPDDYQYMDPELIDILETSVMEYFESDD